MGLNKPSGGLIEDFRYVYMVGGEGGRVEHPNLPWWAISLEVFNKSLSNLAVFTDLKALFPAVSTDFP